MTTGESGAVVLRSADGARYAKFVAADQRPVLETERDRLEWAGSHGIPTAQVLDWMTSSHWACLITSTVPGLSADQLSAAGLWQAWPSITAALRQLHDMPADDCPFSRGLAEMFDHAERIVARNGVNPQFLPAELRHAPAAEVLTQLRAAKQQRLAEEQVDLVICHGDLCLRNIMVDPSTHAVTGFLDLGRLGRADRYVDIALLLTNSRGTWSDEAQAQAADNAFATGYGITVDLHRQLFYVCLDALTWDATA